MNEKNLRNPYHCGNKNLIGAKYEINITLVFFQERKRYRQMKTKFFKLLTTLFSLLNVCIHSFPYKGLQRNKKVILNRMTILANGPSLTQSLNSLDINIGSFTVVNDFYKSEWFFKIKPSSYVVIDPLYFNDSTENKQFVSALNILVSWELTLYVPIKKIKILQAQVKNEFICLTPLILTPIDGYIPIVNFLCRYGLGMPSAQNVLIAAIFATIQKRHNEIILYGADHSWIKNIEISRDNIVYLKDSHFYNTTEVKTTPWIDEYGRPFTMKNIIEIYCTLINSYSLLNSYAKCSNIKIINQSSSSLIDVFER